MRSSSRNNGFRACLACFAASLAWALFLVSPMDGEGQHVLAQGNGEWVVAEDFYSEPIGTDLDVFTHVPMTPGMRKADRTATFKAIYEAEVPQEARAVMQIAMDIWAVFVESPVPIEVEVKWIELLPQADPKSDKPATGLILGRARPTAFRRDFSGAPQKGVWYPNALANRLGGKDLDPAKSDIVAMFNHKAPWYFGTDGATPRGKYDLLTVMLHELGHGLGATSSMKVQEKEGSWGIKDKDGKGIRATVFDTFVKNLAGKNVLDTTAFPNPSEALFAELTGRKLFFTGRLATAANGGALPPLHAPATFKAGASVVHLAENAYPPGSLNSLMTPTNFRAEAIHHPGPVAIGMLRDMGWGHKEALPATIDKARDMSLSIEVIGVPDKRAGMDLYEIPFHAGVKVAITLRGAGSVNLTIQDRNKNAIKELRGTDNLDADFVPTDTGVYRIAVGNPGQANNRYTLTTRCAGLSVAPLQIHRTIDAKEEDRFKISLSAGESVRAVLKGDGDTNLDLYIDDPSGAEIASSAGPTDQEAATWKASAPGVYTVRIRSLGRVWNEYAMSVQRP